MVELHLAKVDVAGSSPVFRLKGTGNGPFCFVPDYFFFLSLSTTSTERVFDLGFYESRWIIISSMPPMIPMTEAMMTAAVIPMKGMRKRRMKMEMDANLFSRV